MIDKLTKHKPHWLYKDRCRYCAAKEGIWQYVGCTDSLRDSKSLNDAANAVSDVCENGTKGCKPSVSDFYGLRHNADCMGGS